MTFKFFRSYNKYLLIGGVCLLMFVFLIEGTLPSGRGDAGKQVIGTIKGTNVILADKVNAESTLRILSHFDPNLQRYKLGDPSQQSLKWLLMMHDAQAMGLHASDAETNQWLRKFNIADAAALSEMASRMDISADAIREAVRQYGVFTLYENLILGGTPRLSPAEMDHVLADVFSTAKTKVVIIPAQRNLINATEPDEKALTELFNQYKDSLPGESKPYGIGFKIPNLAKLEYLEVPGDRVREKVTVDEIDALAFYDKNKQQFFTEEPPQGQTQPAEPKFKPYDEVAPQIRMYLKHQKTDALADRIIRTAAGLLAADSNSLPESGGYKTIPDNFVPTRLSTIAQKIQTQFGILPNVVQIGDHWMDQAEVGALPGLGNASLIQGNQRVKADEYLFSAKEFAHTGEQPLAVLRLQVGLASQPLSTFDGGRLLIRLTQAQASASPQSMEKVKDAVVTQARLLSSYKQLCDSQTTWLNKFNDLTPEGLANDLKIPISSPQPFTRQGSQVDGIGNIPTFVAKVFDLADTLNAAGGFDVAPAQKRSLAVPLDSKLSLALVRVDSIEPLSKQKYDLYRSQPGTAQGVQQVLMGRLAANNPLSLKAIARRVGYEGKNGEEKADEKTPEEPMMPQDAGDQ